MNFNSSLEGATEIVITGNTFIENNKHGISIGGSAGVVDDAFTITENTFSNNKVSQFSDRRYTSEVDGTVIPGKDAITIGNTFVPEEHCWEWDATDVRWLLKPGKALVDPTIKVNDDLAFKSAVGLYDCFTVSTTPGSYENDIVRVKMEVTSENVTDLVNAFALEYVEQNPENPNYRQYLPLFLDESGVAWFGPSAGFPLAAVTDSMFRVTWEEAGEYEFTLKIVAKGDEGEFDRQLASTTVTVNVVKDNAMALEHATAEKGKYASIKGENDFMNAISQLTTMSEPLTKEKINAGHEFDYVIVSDLNNDISHVDNMLFIFEVSKEGISEDDFEITNISLREGTEGINETFEVDGNTLKGYWGPPNGFLFTGEAATAFTIKFNNAGTYTVNTYAIQVEKAAKADLKK
jgi:parallel beta-helix repeat protein